ncbi:MAG: 50S ribosomal protein L24 [Clostridia bacterium]|nr:50S ribosomal protein L24 [Clostridia bacterium]
MKIKKNDTVLVLSGKDAGKTAKVLVAMPKTNKVVVDGVNVQKRHTKARSANQVSEIKSQSGPIDASNVLVVCPTCNKATRVSYKVEGDKKVRVCKKCGAVLDVAEKKEVKKATKKTTAKKVEGEVATEKKTTKRTTKKAEGETAEKPATKKRTAKKAEATVEETNA